MKVLLILKAFCCQNFLTFFHLHDNRSLMSTELYCCTACYCCSHIFYRHWLSMLPGMSQNPMKFLFSITTSFHNYWLTTAAVQEGGEEGWGWCSIWLWLFPLCFRHRSNVLCDAIDWLEYSSHHSEVGCLIRKNLSAFFASCHPNVAGWFSHQLFSEPRRNHLV